MIGAGLLGWIVLAVWTYLVNEMFEIRTCIDMLRIAEERQVYVLLKAE